MICAKCIMSEEVDPKISFDDKNVCNHCFEYDEMIANRISSIERIIALFVASKTQSTLNVIQEVINS